MLISKKRRFASLPDRTSPKQTRLVTPTVTLNYNTQPPPPPTITPADSETEETPVATEAQSFFSPCSSSPSHTITPSSPSLIAMDSSQSTQLSQISDVALYSDDMEMSDSFHLLPGPFHQDPATSISSRTPTPIHSSFAPHIRAEKATLLHHHDPDFADDEAIVDRFRRGRRLPSPISEGEASPSGTAGGLGEMQMEYEASAQDLEKDTPTKKGHTRSKHSLRTWTGMGELGGTGAKRTFSMGYRDDCEKCRNKVPGHFNHIITCD